MASDKSNPNAKEQKTPETLSRRCLLQRSALVAGGAAIAAMSARRAHAQSKMSQADANYQDSPNGDQTCAGCALFVEPSSCQVVDGDISPSGWCKLFVAKG